LTRTQARDLLRFLVCRWYDAGRGHLVKSPVKLSQGTLARKLGISRQWCQVLLGRLRDQGWLTYYAQLLPDGMRGSCVLSAGRQLKRLLVMLAKSRRGKEKQRNSADKLRWRISPSPEERKLLLIRQKENEPPPEQTLVKIPLLKAWLERGETNFA